MKKIIFALHNTNAKIYIVNEIMKSNNFELLNITFNQMYYKM